jgi:REP element-mobilizing transposase RayT
MLASILVATPHAAFGELLRISLEESGQYQVRLVMSGREARASAGRGSFQLAILDTALTDEAFVPLCMDLLDLQKGIRLIVIPPGNNPNHPSLGGLLPHGYLSRPFYLPDLIDTVTRLLNQRSTELHEQKQSSATLPPWLEEPLVMQGYLERELPTTQALAGIVGLHGPTLGSGALRACAGQMGESAAQELANVVFRYWNRDEKTDLMRFVRLAADKKDYLIYATQLTGDLVLILVYDTTAPLSQIRPHTKTLAQTLASHPPDNLPLQDSRAPLETSTADKPAAQRQPGPPAPGVAQQGDQTLPDAWAPAAPGERKPAEDRPQAQVSPPLRPIPSPKEEESEPPFLPALMPEDFETGDNGRAEESINLSALLGPIPSPDSGEEQRDGGWTTDPPAFFPTQVRPGGLEGWTVYGDPGPEDAPAGAKEAEQAARPPATAPLEHRPGAKPPSFDLNLAVEEEIDSLEDTRPHIVAALTSLSQLEPSSPALSQLNYTCVLIPRLPQHYLTGELADRLAHWVQQLCLAFGWRLEGIAIRPEYLQWTVQVSPSISPGNLIRIVRQRTSLHIFSQFTHFNDQNPSGDFWATGYLIVSGAQPPSAQLLRDYIAQTRKRQGVTK